MKRLRIGIIGAGYIGSLHANILAQDERVQIAAIYDAMAERAEALARALRTKAARSAEEVFDQVDAVYVTTPNSQHVELVVAALERNLHVFSEKPMATSLDGARRILEASERSGGIYQVGHNRRFAPAYKFAKRLLEEGELKFYSAHMKMNRGELKSPPWVSNAQVTGGFLYETTIHLLDLARFLLGEIVSLLCMGRASVYQELDDFSMLLTFANGCHATLSSSAHASWLFPFERVEIFGEHAALETQEMERVIYAQGLEREIIIRDYHQLSKEQKWGYVEEDRLFVDAALEGKMPAVTALDGYRSVELVQACYLSARSGERISLPL